VKDLVSGPGTKSRKNSLSIEEKQKRDPVLKTIRTRGATRKNVRRVKRRLTPLGKLKWKEKGRRKKDLATISRIPKKKGEDRNRGGMELSGFHLIGVLNRVAEDASYSI